MSRNLHGGGREEGAQCVHSCRRERVRRSQREENILRRPSAGSQTRRGRSKSSGPRRRGGGRPPGGGKPCDRQCVQADRTDLRGAGLARLERSGRPDGWRRPLEVDGREAGRAVGQGSAVTRWPRGGGETGRGAARRGQADRRKEDGTPVGGGKWRVISVIWASSYRN